MAKCGRRRRDVAMGGLAWGLSHIAHDCLEQDAAKAVARVLAKKALAKEALAKEALAKEALAKEVPPSECQS